MKKFFSIVAAMLLMVGSVSAKTLYFNSGAWATQPGRFAIYCITGESWVGLEAIESEENMYSAEVADSVAMVVFCRMDPALPNNEWASLWNQTEDLTIPENKDMYTITGWGEGYGAKATGDWSVYGDVPATAPETAPAAPAQDEANVMALYCNHYATNNYNFSALSWGGFAWNTLTIDGTDILACSAMTWDAMTNWGADHYDLSAFEKLHIDIWVPAAAKIKITFEALGVNDGGSGYKNGVVFDLVEGWNAIDADLSSWPDNYNFADLRYIMFEQYQTPEGASFEGNPFAVANIYFWKENPTEGIQNVVLSEKAQKVVVDGVMYIIRDGKMFNVQGAQVK